MRDVDNILMYGILRVVGITFSHYPTTTEAAVVGLSMSLFSLWLLKMGSPTERKFMMVLTVCGMVIRYV